MTVPVRQPGSSSLRQPDYWWYRARAELLETVLGGFLGAAAWTLDVGSADGPSVGWMRRGGRRVTLDLHPEGQLPGEGVCGSATALPFADESFDVVAAFDVVEHCEDDALALAELSRVLAPGGRLLISVPAYEWAWSDHDVRAGHYRRYRRRQLVSLVRSAGLDVQRATYAFASVFPFFVAERVVRRLRRGQGVASLPAVGPLDGVLVRLCGVDRRLLAGRDLPFGSSVFLAAVKPAR